MKDPCIICRSTEHRFVCRKNGFDLVRCNSCGLVSVSPLPAKKELEDYYKEGYNQFLYSFTSPLTKPAARKTKELKIVERHANGRRLLDVGSAHGHFMENARRHGWNVTGVEPQDEARTLAKSRFPHHVHQDLSAVSEATFDAATLWHVIEHIANPLEFLSSIGAKLSPDSIIAIATPNVDSLVAKATGKSWGWLSPPDHLYLYSPRTLPRLLELAGFEVLEICTRRGQSRNFLFLMLQAITYRLGLFASVKSSVRIAAGKAQSSKSVTGKLSIFYIVERITGLFSLLLTPGLLVLWRMGLGDEVLAVGRKKKQ